ncbi:hypothetical protein EVAR_61467_1 [Eumeta japonica]|uniref:Uncharacterized protein n=1 Tax=Eumeta variegata TaxID=151549 RepID=A0A4C1Z1Z1_EUMVA|nr:hypothetical protein EVAR_61467_1 [Eumeta japonica]
MSLSSHKYNYTYKNCSFLLDPSHIFDSDSDPTLGFYPSPFLNFSPAFNCDAVPVLDSVPRPAFNFDSATHSSDLDEAEFKEFLRLLYFDPD